MKDILRNANRKIENIRKAKLTIYNPIEIGDPNLWLTSTELTTVLNIKLKDNTLHGLPLRTRSKKVKSLICEALGYQIPPLFKKVQPRFTGQKFDTYVQKSNNLQVWNEELDPQRRYVLIRTDENAIITSVKVVTGSDLAILDTTGTLTQKFQARLITKESKTELISNQDSELIKEILPKQNAKISLSNESPIDEPDRNKLIPIEVIYEKLKKLVGITFKNSGHDQERNRGGELHKIVCLTLGYKNFRDNGQFPDIKHQLLEVKLQTSATIDLGLIAPNSEASLDIEKINGKNIRHCDVRYCLFYAVIEDGNVILKNFYLTTGIDFFKRFPQFAGKVLNKKIQIPLPKNFFAN